MRNVLKDKLEPGIAWLFTVGPLVDVALEHVYTGPGHSPTIECVVVSDPKATVTWYHNNSVDDIDFSQRLNIVSS